MGRCRCKADAGQGAGAWARLVELGAANLDGGVLGREALEELVPRLGQDERLLLHLEVSSYPLAHGVALMCVLDAKPVLAADQRHGGASIRVG